MVLISMTRVWNWYGYYGNWHVLFTSYACSKDYPSAGQIMYVLQEQRIVPIFALIDNDTFQQYQVNIYYTEHHMILLTVGPDRSVTSE